MKYAIFKDNKVNKIGSINELFPNTSFSELGPPIDFLEINSCKVVKEYIQHDSNSHKLVTIEPYLQDNAVFTVVVEPLNSNDIAQRTELKKINVRSERNQKLTESDWTQLADFPKTNQGAWKQYRQALRDLPQQPGFPDNVVWPTPPA